ncbi:hypothetical protein M0D69_09820 [Caballeronia sp. SEWSISQ10-4 2]|uniref:hypothetical protein n=1 Tax=Caballeronia sp. SEWSISQ10-4 2 TaxID=2937438 RepID=UPI00264B0FDC|nr:hypothetical protein [Caballeronia sp. SEWSISQ10-4 2]MDN7178312.1 hypothetical protein [Caballeronia sp. SEWSISQ10-4 2]
MKKAMRKVILVGASLASLCASAAVFAQGGGNGNGGSGGGNAHGAATSGMTHWGDPVATRTNSMPANMQYQGMENSADMGAMAPNSAKGVVKNGQ